MVNNKSIPLRWDAFFARLSLVGVSSASLLCRSYRLHRKFAAPMGESRDILPVPPAAFCGCSRNATYLLRRRCCPKTARSVSVCAPSQFDLERNAPSKYRSHELQNANNSDKPLLASRYPAAGRHWMYFSWIGGRIGNRAGAYQGTVFRPWSYVLVDLLDLQRSNCELPRVARFNAY